MNIANNQKSFRRERVIVWQPWQPGGTTCFFNFKEWFIHDRARLIYDKIWYIIKIKWTCESYTYHAIILLLKVRLISTSISIIDLFWPFLQSQRHIGNVTAHTWERGWGWLVLNLCERFWWNNYLGSKTCSIFKENGWS